MAGVTEDYFKTGFAVAGVAAYVTHVIVAVSALAGGTAVAGYAVLLVLGLLVPPIGAVHGVGVWFGAW